jgi:hypothetical protein
MFSQTTLDSTGTMIARFRASFAKAKREEHPETIQPKNQMPWTGTGVPENRKCKKYFSENV